MGAMHSSDAMEGTTTQKSCTQASSNCFPHHPPTTAAALPKECPSCFAVEPPSPEPSSPLEVSNAEAPTSCNCWDWCSGDCWQWCGGWKSPQSSAKNCAPSTKPSHRQQTWQQTWNDWQQWNAWRSGKSKDFEEPLKSEDSNANHEECPREAAKKSCCGCWQRRRAGSAARRSRSSSSTEARSRKDTVTSEYSDYSELLFRDITPEDYELLVRLDETVKRRTASQENVNSLPRAQSEEALGQVCSVCLDPFCQTDTISILPRCKHLFHKDCVSKWLTERHRLCPLCNVDVFSASM